MKKSFITLSVVIAATLMSSAPLDFFESQLNFSRVKNANANKGVVVNELLSKNNISSTSFDLFLRAFKTEKKLEVWAKDKSNSTYTLLKSYDFCATTGVLGPKRKSGDKQMPEGFYKVDLFNPQSQYHLSFRINYPNKSDLVFADKLNPGDNIFIHGDCVTIGCIPVGNDNIEELYLLAAKAKSGNGDIDVHIFPNKMESANYETIKKANASNKELLTFWSWLKTGYDAFENTKTMPMISIDEKGKYNVN